MIPRSIRPLLLAALAALALAACGRRGPLQPAAVPGEKPAAAEAQPPEGAGVVVSPTGAGRPRRVPIRPGTGSFILDPLL